MVVLAICADTREERPHEMEMVQDCASMAFQRSTILLIARKLCPNFWVPVHLIEGGCSCSTGIAVVAATKCHGARLGLFER